VPPADASAASLLLHCSYPVCACLHETNPRSVADLSGKRDAFMAQLLSMLSGPSGQDIKDEVGGSFARNMACCTWALVPCTHVAIGLSSPMSSSSAAHYTCTQLRFAHFACRPPAPWA